MPRLNFNPEGIAAISLGSRLRPQGLGTHLSATPAGVAADGDTTPHNLATRPLRHSRHICIFRHCYSPYNPPFRTRYNPPGPHRRYARCAMSVAGRNFRLHRRPCWFV